MSQTISSHARRRMDQRAIDETMLRLIEMFGEERYQAGGTFIMRVPKKTCRQLRRAVDKLDNVKTVVDESDKVITAMHDTSKVHTKD